MTKTHRVPDTGHDTARGREQHQEITDPVTANLEVIYHDQSLVAINKPAGLLVHRSAIDFHEKQNAQEQLQAQLQAQVYPVHRLDKPTSGVLLFALNAETAAAVSLQLQNQEIKKDYIAVVRGHAADEGTVDHPVRDKDAPHKPRKEAFTAFTTLARITLPVTVDRYPTTRYSMICAQPASGRRHQIRQHMKHISHPLIGDTSYGKTVHNNFFRQQYACNRLLLHAQKMVLEHPHTGELITLEANYDTQFKRVTGLPEWQWSNPQMD